MLHNIPAERIPRHIAIIMDGNGRWAVRQGHERVRGHQEGAKVVKRMVTECTNLLREFGGPTHLTLYSFSIENWKRPQAEVEFLMQMYIDYLRDELPTMIQQNVRFNQIGRLDNLPDPVLDQVNETLAATKHHTGLTLTLALNYGSRAEIVDAVKSLAIDVQSGKLDPRDISEDLISSRLYTADMPDPDLLVRTAGEMRVSNYLLWQISYAELFVSPTLWPDFGAKDLHEAIRAFVSRNRRFGALDHTNTLAGSVASEEWPVPGNADPTTRH